MKKIVYFLSIGLISLSANASIFDTNEKKVEKLPPNGHLEAPLNQICKVKNNKLTDCKEVKKSEDGKVDLVKVEKK